MPMNILRIAKRLRRKAFNARNNCEYGMHEIAEQWAEEYEEQAEAIEQHHKDLMGLVERWRSTPGPPQIRGEAWDAIMECADELESLINPKD